MKKTIAIKIPKDLHDQVKHLMIDQNLTWQQLVEQLLVKWTNNKGSSFVGTSLKR